MRKVTTRELAHHAKRVQAGLAKGESFAWTSRGRVVGYIQPARSASGGHSGHDWIVRAEQAGAAAAPGSSLGDAIYADRG